MLTLIAANIVVPSQIYSQISLVSYQALIGSASAFLIFLLFLHEVMHVDWCYADYDGNLMDWRIEVVVRHSFGI